jgi:hypothetical protein
MKRLWMGCVGLALGLVAARASAQELQWRPAGPATPAPITVTLSAPVPSATEAQPLRVIPQDAPAAPTVRGQMADPLLGAPVAQAPSVIQVAAQDPLFGSPTQTVPPPPPPPVPGLTSSNPAEDPYNCGQSVTARSGGSIFDQGKDAVAGVFGGGGRNPFQSDHAFDIFASPVTNPFYFQDPRSLTQIKPLFLYQQVPGRNPAFLGGDIWWAGVTGSVAINDMISVVINKLGFIGFHPETTAYGINRASGFSEFSFGPQFTFFRCESTKTVLAAGLLFDLAVGSNDLQQSNGDLSLVPYFSAAQNFGKTDYGSFNNMTTLGYSFSTDHERNDFFYWSNHIDFDVMNLNKIFPMVELNWFHTTNNGNSKRFFGFDGSDLVNFGAGGAAGLNDLSIAVGARYKFTEWLQAGAAIEFPLVNQRDLLDYRLVFDVIIRY